MDTTSWPVQRLHYRSFLILILQIGLISCSLIAAWLLRFEFRLSNSILLWTALPVLIVVRLILLPFFHLSHACWQYTGIRDAVDISKATLAGSIVFVLIVRYGLALTTFPSSIFVLEALITFSLLAAARVLARLLSQTARRNSYAKRLLLVGAGHGAEMIIRETQTVETGYKVIGCADDDPQKRDLRILGVPVLGGIEAVPTIVKERKIDEVLIAIPSATQKQLLRLMSICKDAAVPCRTVPALAELVRGRVTLAQVREFSALDLLGRKPVELDLERLQESLRDRVVMVTGAAGSIGSELCRQIQRCQPSRLVCLDQDETGIFHLQHQLMSGSGACQKVFCVADFCNPDRMRNIFLSHGVEVVFHAAAYKHVPIMEDNVEEAVNNNVLGLLALLKVAQSSNCSAFVMISSDKAVNPTNVMGCTKRIGELMLAAWPGPRMRCVSVRFGNVLGSKGSAIPLFQEQIRKNEPITITHPEMTRFFMTISEAVSLVLEAFVIGRQGDILVLDMGDPVRILDIAKTLARLSGNPDQEFQFIGLRPGEKLFEELFYPDEHVAPSPCDRISCTESARPSWAVLQRRLLNLFCAASTGDRRTILAHLRQIVPQFRYEGCEDAVVAVRPPNAEVAHIPAVNVLPEMPLPVWHQGHGLESAGGPGN